MTDSSAMFGGPAFVTPLASSLRECVNDIGRLIGHVKLIRPGVIPPSVLDELDRLSGALIGIRDQAAVIEQQVGNLRALSGIGQVVNSSLELDVVLRIVMDTIVRLTGAERGFLMLRGNKGRSDQVPSVSSNSNLTIRVARNWEQESIHSTDNAISRTIVNQVVQDCKPILTTNAQQDPRFGGQQSVVAYSLRSILCVPLLVKNELIGVIYTDNRIRSGIFSQANLDLVVAVANQAGVAIENARLFASIRETLEEVTELKNLMDNVFASITSGVITTDVREHITLCNRAAEEILGRTSPELIGQSLSNVFVQMDMGLVPQVETVLRTDIVITGLEVSPRIPGRGQLDLRLSLSPLKDGTQLTQGVAVVVDDLTEKKQLQAQRRLFERMVSPAVISQLDPNSLQLGGRRADITILFADIRGFTSFSETLKPETLVTILNRHLAAAAESILNHSGTIDKFLGDAVMAWFNAPVPQPDHALRSIWAALEIRQAILRLHAEMEPAFRLSFGVGIHTGEAVLGLVGTEKRLEYTAIGDAVNTAKRIQENAGPGQILISSAVYERVHDLVVANPVEPVIAKGKREPLMVYEVIDFKDV